MNKIILLALMVASVFMSSAQNINIDKGINLLIRGDDIGSSHAANVGCIEAYQNGIMQSTELMVCCPWFLEAVAMLKENPGLDVGVHLTLTSEWSNYKWRPITNVPSLVDSNGYFYPMVWQQPHFPQNTSIENANWQIDEIEQELRAQIELALKYVPHVSHINCHMGFTQLNTKIQELVNKLGKEYGLGVDQDYSKLTRLKGIKLTENIHERIERFCAVIEGLTPGQYLFIEHPGKNYPEMRSIGHKGYENVAADRNQITELFTNEKVKKSITNKGIKLISYKDIMLSVKPDCSY